MNIVNWCGCVLLLAGYVALTLPNPSNRLRKWGILTSGFGTTMVGIWAFSVHAWPILIMETVFTVASIVQFCRIRKVES